LLIHRQFEFCKQFRHPRRVALKQDLICDLSPGARGLFRFGQDIPSSGEGYITDEPLACAKTRQSEFL